MGHRVVTAEPVDELREPARALYPSAAIEWIGDGLPGLPTLISRADPFDLIKLTGVWMHLDADERAAAMPTLAGLLSPGGRLLMSLRHGPVPTGRRMFEVTAEETVDLAKQEGLAPLLTVRTESIQPANRLAGVTWTWLGFVRHRPSLPSLAFAP